MTLDPLSDPVLHVVDLGVVGVGFDEEGRPAELECGVILHETPSVEPAFISKLVLLLDWKVKMQSLSQLVLQFSRQEKC